MSSHRPEPAGEAPPQPLPEAWRPLWPKVCQFLDGIALGTTVEVLERAGVLAALASQSGRASVESLARRSGLHRGYLRLALRLLATQGWLDWGKDEAHRSRTGAAAVGVTSAGAAWLAMAPAYRGSATRLAEATALPALLDGDDGSRPASIDADGRLEMSDRVRRHREGPLVASLLHECRRRGLEPRADSNGRQTFDWEALGGARDLAIDLFTSNDWIADKDGAPKLTPEGVLAFTAAPQFAHSLSYLPTFADVPRLLAGEGRHAPSPGGDETHLDRALDIRFSGEVFRKTCAAPFLEIVLPIFERDPLEQPVAVVDVGCGDGTLLEVLYQALLRDNARGRDLDEQPLCLVGVDPAPAARSATSERLGALGAPVEVMDGDIGDPGRLARRLEALGIPPGRALFATKSVLHDREFRPPRPTTPAPQGEVSTGVFLGADGEPLAAVEIERNLVEVLTDWRSLLGPLGMIVIEAHTVSPTRSALYAGRHLITPLEATHGYSHQYLIEAARFRNLVRQAGYEPHAERDLSTWMVGQPLMTLDHLVPRGDA